MSNGYEIKLHPEFEKDTNDLSKKEKEILYKNIEKIKNNPTRFSHLSGGTNCYRLRFLNYRIVYYIEGKVVWLLILDKREKVYNEYLKRLQSLKVRFSES